MLLVARRNARVLMFHANRHPTPIAPGNIYHQGDWNCLGAQKLRNRNDKTATNNADTIFGSRPARRLAERRSGALSVGRTIFSIGNRNETQAVRRAARYSRSRSASDRILDAIQLASIRESRIVLGLIPRINHCHFVFIRRLQGHQERNSAA